MPTLILLRHGQSTWNLEERFTGWVDVGLTERGLEEARDAGSKLAGADLHVSVVHTSLLVRAIRTAEVTLAEAGRSWVPVRRHWRLNERHYGALQGATHEEMAQRYGAQKVHDWRRSYDVRPPQLSREDPQHPRHDDRYSELAPEVLPGGECLRDVVARMLPYYHDAIVPELIRGDLVLVVAHGNSLRALMKHLERISDEDIPELEIPTGVPIVYRMSPALEVEERKDLLG